MSLLISLKNAPDSVIETSKSFGDQGGTIGRGPDNLWVLEDPERYLSACHCRISLENGQYYITDLSTNGTFYNGSANPIGKGAKTGMKDGDTFIIGDYELNVSISKAKTSPDAAGGDYSDPFAGQIATDPFAGSEDFASPGFSGDPFASAHRLDADDSLAISAAETDPLAALDKAQGNPGLVPGLASVTDPFGDLKGADPFASDETFGATFSDQADPLNQQISWPGAISEKPVELSTAIPDDWDDEPEVTPVVPPVQPSMPLTEPPAVPAPGYEAEYSRLHSSPSGTQSAISEQHSASPSTAEIQAELMALKEQIRAQRGEVATSTAVDTSLMEAMGLPYKNLSDEEILKTNRLAGDVMREMVKGLMQVLGSRGSVKNEFRMHVTTIQPVENNPLKFSANVDDALENMFVKQGNAYKKPVEAVQEGFDSIAEHQVAILAGIKMAFKGVIERFDPALLEERFAHQNKGSFMPVNQKAKNWEYFTDYYNEMAKDLDNSFQYLFGDDFVKAYEDQLQKMAISRKARATKDKGSSQ